MTRIRRDRSSQKPFAPNAKKAIELSLRETIRLGGREIADESLLLGLLRTSDSEVSRILKRTGTDQANLRTELESRIGNAS